MYNQIAIQPQHIKSCNPSPTHHPVGVGLHARPRGLSGHLTLTSIIQLPYTNTPTSCSRGQADRQTDRQTDRPFILINHSSFAIKMSQPNINTPNSDLVSSLSQSQSYLSPNFLVILPGLTSSVRLCGVERCPAQQSEEEEEEENGAFVPIITDKAPASSEMLRKIRCSCNQPPLHIMYLLQESAAVQHVLQMRRTM